MRSEYFFGFIISFTLGVFLESVFDFGYAFGILWIVVSLVVLLAASHGLPRMSVLLVSLVFFGCGTGILRVDVSQMNTDAHSLDGFMAQKVLISGTIIAEPDVREKYTNVVLEVDSVLYEERRVTTPEKPHILVRVPMFPAYLYGDEVEIYGKINHPKNFEPDEQGKVFDYVSYLAKDNIYYQMFFPNITVVSHNKGNVVIEKLFAFKGWLMKNISRTIPEPEASLAGGITLGAKQSLGEELLQKFRETGVAHIVVLSGYNIAVVAGIVSRLVLFLPFAVRLSVSAVGVILFAMMVGGGATVVRATVMALIVIIARVLGREADGLRALVLAGGLMVFANPMILLHDVSFELSFSATLALVTLVPVMEKYFTWVPPRVLREIMVTTIATQIFVLPLILYHMGSVSLIGLVANIFILPVVPLAMFVVGMAAAFAWVPFVSGLASSVAYFLLAYIFAMVEFFARIPFASLQNISFPLVGLVGAYAVLAVLIIKNFPQDEYQVDEVRT